MSNLEVAKWRASQPRHPLKHIETATKMVQLFTTEYIPRRGINESPATKAIEKILWSLKVLYPDESENAQTALRIALQFLQNEDRFMVASPSPAKEGR